MFEVSYLGDFEEDGEKFAKATITHDCGWVHHVRESFEDFEAAIKQEMEDHKCMTTTTTTSGTKE